MYKRPSNNPFGEWNKIPSVEQCSLNEQAVFDKKWEEFCTEEISEDEVTSYLENLNTVVLNEMGGYAERGWFGISPFAWTEGFNVGSIFKPLKWLALPLIGGTVLLLAGIWKLLKEGKKQIAIAKVRSWIQKIVVLADSGLKKTRSTKDSLFLIRQRYRRDILQNAVKVATCLGLPVEEKDTKPESVETSLNESDTSTNLENDAPNEETNLGNDTNTNLDSSDNSTDTTGSESIRIADDVHDKPQLPDDSRVDWSLMNSVRASQWFGLKHKTTNFWKEAKSVAVVDTKAAQGNTLRECGLIVSYVSQSLTLVANSGVAQKYASTMNKYIEALTDYKTSDNLQNQSGRLIGGNRFYSSNINNSMNYDMFSQDFKIFEDSASVHQNEIENMIKDQGFIQYLTKYEEESGNPRGTILNDFKEGNYRNFDEILNHYNNYKLRKEISDMLKKYQHSTNNLPQEDGTPLNTDNIDKYLVAALSKILANTNFNEWQMHNDAYNQMMKFINELTKTVHTVIDSVAKKVEEKIGASGNTFEQAVLRFVSSKPDAKQNRSLKNLWDNIGMNKLQQRTIVHCQEIDSSPEMQYYLDMFMITVPSVIKSKLVAGKQSQEQKSEEQKETNKTETE